MKVLVTGATEGFGLLVMNQLKSNQNVKNIIALKSSDIDFYDEEEDKVEMVSAKNLRPRLLENIFKSNTDIDVIIHTAYVNKPKNESGKFIHETNVFGTLRLLTLAKKYGVKKFIYKSPSSIYGANPDNPALIKEDYPLRGNRSYQALRDKIEADSMCQIFMNESSDLKIVILRFCGIIGDHIRSPLNTIFRQPFIPTIMGFDPMFQIMHEDDVVQAILQASFDKDLEGVFNIAGKITQPLSEVIARLGKIPMPFSNIALELFYKPFFMLKRDYVFPFDITYWKYPFVINTKKSKEIMGFKPKRL